MSEKTCRQRLCEFPDSGTQHQIAGCVWSLAKTAATIVNGNPSATNFVFHFGAVRLRHT